MAVLRGFFSGILTMSVLLAAGGRGEAHMGPVVPLAHPRGEEAELMANLVASYVGEQMGREIRLLPFASSRETLLAVSRREAPLAVVPEEDGEELPADLVAVGPPLPGPAGRCLLVAGREAAGQLQFSLLPDYLRRLSRALAGFAWGKDTARIRRGEGARKVVLDLLRSLDLL